MNVKLNQPNPFEHWQGHVQSECLDTLLMYSNVFFIAVSGTHTECKLFEVVIKQYTSHKNTATEILLAHLERVLYIRAVYHSLSFWQESLAT